MKQCPGKYCQSRLTPPRSCYFIVYSLSTLICTWDDMYAIVFLHSLHSPSASLTFSLLIWYIPSLQSRITHLHIHFTLLHSHAHTHSFPPLVSLAHVFHLVLPFLCLFLTSLYSQLSIGTIPANYPQCHSHYFPISATNLLHTFLSPTLADPSAPRQLLANFSSLSTLKRE